MDGPWALKRLQAIVRIGLALAVSAPADGSWFPSNFTISAEPVGGEEGFYKLKVSWTKVENADVVTLYRSNTSSDSPILNSTGADTGWEQVRSFGPQDSQHIDPATFTCYRYAIVAENGDSDTPLVESRHTGLVCPNFPPAPAIVEDLRVSNRGTDELTVQWNQSEDTVYSRVETRRINGALVDTQESSGLQSVTVSDLDPNTSYEIEVCVRNGNQTAADETCGSISTSTLPLTPFGVRRIWVDEEDPDPRSRRVHITYDNQQSSAVRGINLCLIREGKVLERVDVRPSTTGVMTHDHTFANLDPFSDYEAWAIPYNESEDDLGNPTGVGPAAGIGFTTPALVILSTMPLSGDSVMLRLLNTHVGEYVVSVQSTDGWREMCRLRPGRTGETQVVLYGLAGPRLVAVAWRLAHLRSQTEIEASPLSGGAPELVRLESAQTYVSRPQAMTSGMPRTTREIAQATRNTVTFRVTGLGNAEYVLQRSSGDAWLAVATMSGSFAPGEMCSIAETTQARNAVYRVCRQSRFTMFGRTLGSACSTTSPWASGGLERILVSSN